jgi:hypothetical protein
MKELIDSFSAIIDRYEVVKDQVNPKITELKIRIVFADQSILEYSEVNVIQIQKRKYSFQWMEAGYQLLVRWDNASHHTHIATHPHHKHVQDEKNILESDEMTLEKVLKEIETKLTT